MSTELVIMPGTVVSWKQFCKEFPGNSIALDGFVNDGPKFDRSGPHANFNHHERVSRLETRATCAQVLLAIRQGLFNCFSQDKKLWIFANGCDEDLCLSIYILIAPLIAVSTINPFLNQLVSMEDFLDTTAGAYAFPRNMPSLAKVLWVFEPYMSFRDSGGLGRGNEIEYREVISAVGERIRQFITGSAKSIVLDTRYDVLYDNGKWKMVKEIGQHARIGMFADGIQAFVSLFSKGYEEGTHRYVVGRTSQFIDFPLPLFFNAFNVAEGIAPTDSNRWGGASTVGGSPRRGGGGSKLSPEKVIEIINGIMKKRKFS